MSIQKKIAKNAFYNFLVKVIALAFAFIASIVVARFLGPERYGIYSLVIWLLSTVGLLAHLGIPTTITKYVSEYWGREDLSIVGSILSRLLRLEILAGVLVSLILFFLAPTIARWYNNPPLSLYLKVASLVILPLVLMWFYNGLFTGLQRFDLIAKINLFVSPLTLMVILVVLYLGGKIQWLIGVSGITNLLLVASYLNLKRRKFGFIQKGPSPGDLGGKLLKFSASAFVVILLDAVVWERFGIFFLSTFSTSSEIAFYNVAFILSSRTMVLLPGALTGILMPAMSEVFGKGDREELKRTLVTSTRYLAMLSFPICLGGIAIARQLFPILYGASFQPASFIFCILLLGGACGSISTSSSSLLYAAELQRVVVRVGILSALILIAGSWFLVPQLEAKGAAFATVLAQITSGGVMITYAYKKYMKLKFPQLNLLRILIASALMGGVAFFLTEAFKGPVGLILALIVSSPIYIFGLFLTKSLTSDDIELMESIIGRLPEAWAATILRIFRWLIKRLYPNS